MKQEPAIMNRANMIIATEQAKTRVQSWLDLATDVSRDSRKAERLKHHECKACFYSDRIGGAAMTFRNCMSCEKEQIYATTATDVLCMDCAKKHILCKRCGGDLEMRTRRRSWPEGPNITTTPEKA